jgi:hypothetical protein
MALVREYIDRYHGDEMEDIFKLLDDRLVQVIKEYVQKKSSNDKSWLNPNNWIPKILQDNELGKETKDFWIQALRQHSYYKGSGIVKEALNFERGLDSKKALQLGILNQIINFAHQKTKIGDFSLISPESWFWEIRNNKEIDTKTKELWLKYIDEHRNYLKSKKFLDLFLGIKESQDFQRRLAPKQAMGIGLEETIRNFLNEKTSSSPSLWISYLLNEGDFEEVDKETRKKWIKFLITKPEYNSELGEEEYYILKEWDINWIPYVPLSDSNFKYKKIANNYILSFAGWENFSPYFDYDSRDLSKDFIEKVLSGDAYDEFIYDSEAFLNIEDIVSPLNREIKKGKKIHVLEDLKEKAIEMGGNPENMEDLDSLFSEINNNENLSELKDQVSIAFEEAQQSADEFEAFKKVKESIKKQFIIEEGKWSGEGSEAIYEAPISFEGLSRLAYTMATKEEEIKYYHPYGGYNGDIEAETFNDAMYNRLEDL